MAQSYQILETETEVETDIEETETEVDTEIEPATEIVPVDEDSLLGLWNREPADEDGLLGLNLWNRGPAEREPAAERELRRERELRWEQEQLELWRERELLEFWDNAVIKGRSCRGIIFLSSGPDVDADLPFLQAAANSIVSSYLHVDALYVGGTSDVVRRWLGDLGMRGHSETYTYMHVLHVAHGAQAASVETHLIRWAAQAYPALCQNRAMDSRGLSRYSVNLIYLVVRIGSI